MTGNRSVFTKIFLYTMLLLALMSLAAAALFSRQFLAFYRSEEQRHLASVFEPMIAVLSDTEKSPAEIAGIARVFAESNQSFRFLIRGHDGTILFSTPGAEEELEREDAAGGLRVRFASLARNAGELRRAYVFAAYRPDGRAPDYRDLWGRSLLALALMIGIAFLGAILFAKTVTRPLEEELAREKIAEENQRLFFSAASHELKTPVAAARALVEGMLAGVGDYGDHPKYLRECIKTLDSQSRLVSEILEIVKLADEGAGTAPEALDLPALAASLAEEYRPLAEEQGLELRVELPPGAVWADRNLLLRSLSNLIANGIQNTPPGGSVRIGSEAGRGGRVRLTVFNTGARIPGELLPRLFEPFYRLDSARTRGEGPRSGLGLAIVKKALDRMGAPFSLENTPEGVRFWVELPPA